MSENWLIIGISGTTCAGKTTLANSIHSKFSGCKIITQDDYYFEPDDPRIEQIPELNHQNYDVLSSLDMEKMLQDINSVIKNRKLSFINSDQINQKKLKSSENKNIENVIKEKIKCQNIKLLIIEGFSIFNYRPIANLCDLKYYIVLDKEECYRRRLERTYEPPDVPGYFEKYVWPQHLRDREDVQKNVRDVIWLDGKSPNLTEELLKDILCIISD